MKRKSLTRLLVASGLALISVVAHAQTTKTRIGKLDFDGGYPSRKTVDRLYEEVDFQRAVQAYLWTLPTVGYAQWRHEHENVFGAEDGDVVYYESHRDKLGILTANTVTPYVVGFLNLEKTGPVVIEHPAGPTAGGILDSWQRPLSGTGRVGPDKGNGGKYLLLGPGQSVDDTAGFIVVQSTKNNIFHSFRILTADPDEAKQLRESYRVYPHRERSDPPQTRVITPDGREWTGAPPNGLAYWELVAGILGEDTVSGRERILLDMLERLGIKRGEPFTPDDRQKKVLREAAVVGDAMARSLSYGKRQQDARVYEGRQWTYAFRPDTDKEAELEPALDQPTDWLYQGVTQPAGLTTKTPGQRQVLSVRKDVDGEWLQGEKSYTLRIPADPPVEQFWTLTLYDAGTRCFIENAQEIAGVDSRRDLIENEDGSIVLHFGPKAPEGGEKNWIQTVRDRGWFAYFRLYAPTEAFFDKSWKLPEIRRSDIDDDQYGGGG